MNLKLKLLIKLFLQYFLAWSIFLCGLLASCSKEEAADFSLTETDELRLGAAITGITRATDAGFEIGDTLGIFITKWQDASARDTLKESGNYTDNVLFRLENLSNDWVAEYPVYFPSDDNKIDLYAYYPYRNPAFVSGTSLGVKVFANQSLGNHYTRSDFMTAKTLGVSRTPNKVPLIFDHRLSQMVFILKPGAGFSVADLLPARLKIINAITDATFDLRDSFPVAGSVRSDIIPAGSWTAGSESLTGMKAILIPQELNPDTYVEITLGSRRFTYKPASVHLNPGCSRVFTITVNNTGLDITTEINPWDNCPPVNGDAYEEFDLDTIVTMVTKRSNPSFIVEKQDDILVDWGDGTVERNVFKHTYTDNMESHVIRFYGLTDALTELFCSPGQLLNLDISKNKALTFLYCSGNLLDSLNVSLNTALTHLFCSNNRLSDLYLSKNIRLKNLDCSVNLLSDLDLSKNIKLEYLVCKQNQLLNLDLSKNKELVELDCRTNVLTDLNISQNTKLIKLQCADNKLQTLMINNNIELQNLDCSVNELSDLELSRNVKLLMVSCYKNQLSNLDLTYNTLLVNLFCDNNELTSLNLTQNIALTNIECHHNQLSVLDISRNIALISIGCYNNQLAVLDISQNKALSTIECSNNLLTNINLGDNEALNTLHCRNNPFITDQIILTEVVNALPNKTKNESASIWIGNSDSYIWIKDICNSKNWSVF